MNVGKTEVARGLVLLKLCSNDRPVSMSLIESNNNSELVKINGVNFYIIRISAKYNTKRQNYGERNWIGWNVLDVKISVERQKKLANLVEKVEEDDFRFVIVYTTEDFNKTKDWKICVLEQEQIRTCLDLDQKTQKDKTLHIGWKGKQSEHLRVVGDRNCNSDIENEWIKIPQNYLESMELPWRKADGKIGFPK